MVEVARRACGKHERQDELNDQVEQLVRVDVRVQAPRVDRLRHVEAA